MNDLSNQEFPRLTDLPRPERIRERQKIFLRSGGPLKRLQALHQQQDASQKELLPDLWLMYQAHFPTELAQTCRGNDPTRTELTDQQILEQNLPKNWDWQNIQKCSQTKLNILKSVQQQLTA